MSSLKWMVYYLTSISNDAAGLNRCKLNNYYLVIHYYINIINIIKLILLYSTIIVTDGCFQTHLLSHFTFPGKNEPVDLCNVQTRCYLKKSNSFPSLLIAFVCTCWNVLLSNITYVVLEWLSVANISKRNGNSTFWDRGRVRFFPICKWKSHTVPGSDIKQNQLSSKVKWKQIVPVI